MWPERFGNHFVVRKIASGGMSDVYLCRLRGEEGFEKQSAVKVIHPRLSASARFRDLFVREARIAAALSHPNLVQVFDFGREGESLYLAMEFVPGWNLAQVAAQLRSQPVSLPLEIWRLWTEGMIDGLGYLHARKIVHRDISPGNVLLSRSGVVKITDFGIARPGTERAHGRGGWEGKASSLSPEQALGEPATFRSDLFSAAVVSAELFLPGRLFGGTDEEAILSRIRSHTLEAIPSGLFPPEVAGVLRKALHPQPEERYPDAERFSRAIAEAVPAAPARAALASFFDALFPGQPPDEETIVSGSLPSRGRSVMVRERKGEYGAAAGRRLGIGIAAGLAAVSLGTYLVVGASRERPREPSSPPPSALPAAPVPSLDIPAEPPNIPAAKGGKRDARPAELPAAERKPRSAVFATEEPPRTLLLRTDPEGATVLREDGAVLGKTPLRLDLSSWGGDALLLREEGFVDRRIPAGALSGLSELRVELERRWGTIPVLQAIPWAMVYEGERFLGVTPISSLRLPVGPHTLRFVNEELRVDRYETVRIREGANPKLVVPLVRREQDRARD